MATVNAFVESVSPGRDSGRFTGTLKESGSIKEFVDAIFYDSDGNQVKEIGQIGLDSLVSFDNSVSPITTLKFVIQVIVIGQLNRPNTETQIKNLVTAIEKEGTELVYITIKK